MENRDELEAWTGLSLAYHHVSDKLDDVLRRRHELCISWFEVLTPLARQLEGMRVSDLSAQVTLSQPRVSRILHSLEARGLVNRVATPGDARGTEVHMTPEGRDLYAEARRSSEEVMQKTLLAWLESGESRVLRDLGTKLAGEQGLGAKGGANGRS